MKTLEQIESLIKTAYAEMDENSFMEFTNSIYATISPLRNSFDTAEKYKELRKQFEVGDYFTVNRNAGDYEGIEFEIKEIKQKKVSAKVVNPRNDKEGRLTFWIYLDNITKA